MTAIYFHIPKTAGTTFQEVIRKNLPSHSIKHFRGHIRLEDKEILEATAIKDLVFGHFRFREGLISDENVTFTFLRNPVERCISNFFHYRRTGRFDKSLSLMKQVDFFLSEEELKQNGNYNLQTQFMTGMVPQRDFIAQPAEYLQQAKSNLEKLSFVGITENFEASVHMICQELGWKKWYFVKHNVGSHADVKAKILKEFGPRLQEINQLDQELYEYGLQLFESQRNRIEVPRGKVLKAKGLSLIKKIWKKVR